MANDFFHTSRTVTHAGKRTLQSSQGASLLMVLEVSQQHLDLAPMELAPVLHQLDQCPCDGVDAARDEVFPARGARVHAAPAGAAHDVGGRAEGEGEVPGQLQAHRALQLRAESPLPGPLGLDSGINLVTHLLKLNVKLNFISE